MACKITNIYVFEMEYTSPYLELPRMNKEVMSYIRIWVLTQFIIPIAFSISTVLKYQVFKLICCANSGIISFVDHTLGTLHEVHKIRFPFSQLNILKISSVKPGPEILHINFLAFLLFNYFSYILFCWWNRESTIFFVQSYSFLYARVCQK